MAAFCLNKKHQSLVKVINYHWAQHPGSSQLAKIVPTVELFWRFLEVYNYDASSCPRPPPTKTNQNRQITEVRHIH